MVEVTLFEIDLQDSSFSASRPFGGAGDEAATGTEGTPERGASGPKRGLAVALGLLFLVVLAVAVRRTLDGEGIDTT